MTLSNQTLRCQKKNTYTLHLILRESIDHLCINPIIVAATMDKFYQLRPPTLRDKAYTNVSYNQPCEYFHKSNSVHSFE